MDRWQFFRYDEAREGEGIMKVTIRIDPGCGTPSVTITAPALTDEIKALAARLESGDRLIGWRDGSAFPIPPETLLRCYGEDKGVKAQTANGVFDLKERLYELEARLDRHTFVRTSQSEIVNLTLTGTIKMTLAGDTVCYVSRRYVKKIKEALGL